MMFVSFFLVGLVPPFSEFFTTVISLYDIYYLHLNPNYIIMQSIFAHQCENFVGVKLCLHLFRFFYTYRSVTKPANRSYGFCLHDGATNSYIKVGLKSS